ncbi:response regulator [Deltaproteobacteria bacterium TL4]
MEKIKSPLILIVDDEPRNISLLGNILKLKNKDFNLVIATDGKQALENAKLRPDLILLDVMMPELNGFEVCQQLKQDPETKEIPVIFLTAKVNPEDVVKGFELGAVDYVTKPFNSIELLVRVETHLKLSSSRQQIEQQARELRDMNNELRKTQAKIVQSAKLASLGKLATGVAHEINQPLSYIKTILQTTREDLKLEDVNIEDSVEVLDEALRQTERITDIISHLRTFGREEEPCFYDVNLGEVFNNTLLLMKEQIRVKNIALIYEIEESFPLIKGKANQLEQVFINLLQNSIDGFLESPQERQINVAMRCITEKKKVSILFKDNASGIPEKHLANIFDPFYTTKPMGKGTGLGLSIVYGIIKSHLGEITCHSQEGIGTTFMITLPVKEATS